MGLCTRSLQNLVNWDAECHGSVSSEPSEPCELRPVMPWVCVLWVFRTLWTETWNAMGPCPLSLQNLVNWDPECHGSVSSEPSEPCELRPGMPWVCVLWAVRTLWTETRNAMGLCTRSLQNLVNWDPECHGSVSSELSEPYELRPGMPWVCVLRVFRTLWTETWNAMGLCPLNLQNLVNWDPECHGSVSSEPSEPCGLRPGMPWVCVLSLQDLVDWDPECHGSVSSEPSEPCELRPGMPWVCVLSLQDLVDWDPECHESVSSEPSEPCELRPGMPWVCVLSLQDLVNWDPECHGSVSSEPSEPCELRPGMPWVCVLSLQDLVNWDPECHGSVPLSLQNLVDWDLERHGSVSSEASEPCELRPGMPWVCVLWAFRTLWTETRNAMGLCPLSLQNLVNWDPECHGSVSYEPSEPCELRPGMPWVCVLSLQDLVDWDRECHGSVSSEPSEPCELRPRMPWVCVLSLQDLVNWDPECHGSVSSAFRTLWTETWNAMGLCTRSLQNLVNWDPECHGSVSSKPSEPYELRPGMPWVCVLWTFRTLWTETWNAMGPCPLNLQNLVNWDPECHGSVSSEPSEPCGLRPGMPWVVSSEPSGPCGLRPGMPWVCALWAFRTLWTETRNAMGLCPLNLQNLVNWDPECHGSCPLSLHNLVNWDPECHGSVSSAFSTL